MRSVLSLTVAAVIAVHSVFGCCWHHAHVAAADAEATEPSLETADHICRQGFHAHEIGEHDASQAESHHDDPSHHCPTPCSEKCQIASTGRVQLDDSSLDTTLDVSFGLNELVPEPVVITWKFALDDVAAEPPPLSLHSLHQLLLI